MEPAARLAAPFATLITLFWQLRLRSRETAEQRRLSLQDAPLRSLVVGLREVVQLRGHVQENVQVFFFLSLSRQAFMKSLKQKNMDMHLYSFLPHPPDGVFTHSLLFGYLLASDSTEVELK